MQEDKNQLQDDIQNFALLVKTAKDLIQKKVPVFLMLLGLNIFGKHLL